MILDYPGENPPEVQVLHEYDKVYEGSLSFCATTTEEIRDEIAKVEEEVDFQQL